MAAVGRKVVFAAAVVAVLSVLFQVWQIWSFVNAGPRFTAQDGKALCERVRALEQLSYGYRDSGQSPADCRYSER